MSAVDSQILVQDRPRPESPDVIDVDAFEADDIVYVGSSRPSQRRDGPATPVDREVIHVTDNEDDNEIQFIGHNPARPRPPHARRERIFSPPPPLQADGIPPVPRIPQRFLTLRPHPSPGPIIPNEVPFPFEADLRPPVEQAPVAVAPSHHIPSMGFGGALLAGVRRIMGPRDTPHQVERRNSWGVAGSFVLRWDPVDYTGDEEEILDELGALWDDDDAYGARRVRNQIEQAFKQHGHDHQAEPDYKQEYTHPRRPLAGFTHDFSPSSSSSALDEDVSSPSCPAGGSGSRSCDVTLVCPSCHDPLILGASDVGEDRAKRKLWGLRCGHLLDGKCIEKLMEPAPPPPDVAESSSTASLDYLSSAIHDSMVDGSDAYSVRSRLRPRRGTGSFPSSSHSVSATPSSGRRGAHAKNQVAQRSNRKGKGKMKAPIVEAEHEWMCPVAGCDQPHLSLLMDGRWTMDEKRGAIAVFV